MEQVLNQLFETGMKYLKRRYKIKPSILERNETWAKFPDKIDNVWLAGDWCSTRRGGRRKYKMPYFIKDEYQEYKTGQIVHLLTIGKWRGFYQITKIEKSYGDYAMWDDGKKYWFSLADIKRVYKKKKRAENQ